MLPEDLLPGTETYMELAKVIGQVVSTVRCPGLPYNSLLLVDLLNEKGESIGRSQVAADPIGAGEGEWVIVSRGSSARFAIDKDAPLDLVIVGIVDHVNAGKAAIYRKNQGNSPCGRFAAHRKTPRFSALPRLLTRVTNRKKQAPRPAVLKVPRGPASSIGV